MAQAQQAQMFRTLLAGNRAGALNAPTINTLVNVHGIVDIQTFVAYMTEEQVKSISKMVRHVTQAAPNTIDVVQVVGQPAVAVPNPAKTALINVVAGTKLHAIWYWAVLRERCGKLLSASAQVLTQAEITKVMARIQFEKDVKTAEADSNTGKKPHVLKKLEKFNEWYDVFNTHLYTCRGAARIPLCYLYRDMAVPTQEMKDAEYESSDEEYMTLFALAGSYYQVDNATLFNELMQYVEGGPGESIVKPYRSARNGREAMLALFAYANGTDARERRAADAYNVLETTTFNKMSRNYGLDDFLGRLRDTYTILAHPDIGQAVAEQRKWQDTLEKIHDPNLEMVKMTIKNSASLHPESKTFEQLASKLKELSHDVYKKPHPRAGRLISSTKSSGSPGPPIKDCDVTNKDYSQKDWGRLTSEQKSKVQKLRRTEKEAKKRRVKSAERKEESDDDMEIDSASEDAGTQFGRNAHKSPSKKQKKK